MSNRFYEIEQKERPVECALCSVKDGVHAMYPLFDYHGTGGRQICSKSKSGERKLVWAHALCALYLASHGYLYACYKDGDYIGMEKDNDENNTDSRPPNPELVLTEEFARMYGTSAMPHFRYYMTPRNGELDPSKLDPYTKAVLAQQNQVKCIVCGLPDDSKKSMRIPLQCVANDDEEFKEFKVGRLARSNDVTPCTQALHIGCARWGNPSSKVRQCFYFHGDAGEFLNVLCLYCKKHSEDVNEKCHKVDEKDPAFLKKKRAEEKDGRGETQQGTIAPKKTTKQISSSLKDRRSDGKEKVSQKATMKENTVLGKRKAKEAERRKETDRPSAAAINAGEQPTLAKRRRQIANEKSSIAEEDANIVFDDLLRHLVKIARNPSMMKERKRYWKHVFSEASTMEFDNIWVKARKRFKKHQNRQPNTDSELEKMLSVATQKSFFRIENKDANLSDTISSDDDGDIDTDMDGLNSGGTAAFDGKANGHDLGEKPKRKQSGQLCSDRWSNLFIGLPFEMGNEFTIEKLK